MNEPGGPDARSWPFFNTPLRVFLAVVAPISALMALLATFTSRASIRYSAIAVLAVSIYAAVRGYACRVRVDPRGVEYRAPWRTIRIEWSRIRAIDRYTPGVGGAGYIFITTHDGPPAGRWDVDAETIQIQERDGLLAALREAHARWTPSASAEPSDPSPGS